jgi:hypothetical protein
MKRATSRRLRSGWRVSAYVALLCLMLPFALMEIVTRAVGTALLFAGQDLQNLFRKACVGIPAPGDRAQDGQPRQETTLQIVRSEQPGFDTAFGHGAIVRGTPWARTSQKGEI